MARKRSKHRGTKTTTSWNPFIGCLRHPFVSDGCGRCYLYRTMRRSKRFNPDIVTPTKGLDVSSAIKDAPPMHWRKRDIIFTCSLSDFFIIDGDQWRPKAWEIIRRTRDRHIYRILTKRPQRILSNPEKCLPPDWSPENYPNVWLGVSVESPKYYWRMDVLNRIPCKLKWLSCEPLLEPLPDLHQHIGGIKWVYTGGETDRWDPRPKGGVPQDWFLDIRDQCVRANIPFHFLQQGGSKPCRCGCFSKYGCRKLGGKMYQQYPVPTLVADGPKKGKRQRERILRLLDNHNIHRFKTPVQTESSRGKPRQIDRILLADSINDQTLGVLQESLPDTTMTLQTWL